MLLQSMDISFSQASTMSHLPRMISQTSGFFLWGMMLEPVVSSSGKCMKPKFGHMYMQQSEANLLRVSATEPIAEATLLSALPLSSWAATLL